MDNNTKNPLDRTHPHEDPQATIEDLQREVKRLGAAVHHLKSSSDGNALALADSIIEMSPAVLFRRMADDNYKLVYVSKNISQWGYRAEDFLQGTLQFKDIVLEEDAERMGEEISLHRDADKDIYDQEYRIRTADGEIRHVSDRTSVVRDADGKKIFNQGLVVDITDQRKAEEELRKSEEKFRRIIETAAEGFTMLNEDLIFVDVNASFLNMLGYERHEILGRSSIDILTPASRRIIQAQKEIFLKQTVRRFEIVALTKDGHEVPALVHGNTLTDAQGDFIGNVSFVTDISYQKKAMRLAEEVQRGLQPQSAPKIPGLDVAGRSIASEEVGGDYFDYIRRPGNEERLLVTVGDVSGHGVDAALLMTSARAFLRMRAGQVGGIAELATDLNHQLAQDLDGTGRFMTMFMLSTTPNGKDVYWVRAGHDPACVYRPQEDTFDELDGEGLPLGIVGDLEYESLRMDDFQPGQITAIGTDGIWEARNAQGEFFGKERFRSLLRRHAQSSAQRIVDAVYEALDAYTGGVPLDDDVTLVIIKRIANDTMAS